MGERKSFLALSVNFSLFLNVQSKDPHPISWNCEDRFTSLCWLTILTGQTLRFLFRMQTHFVMSLQKIFPDLLQARDFEAQTKTMAPHDLSITSGEFNIF